MESKAWTLATFKQQKSIAYLESHIREALESSIALVAVVSASADFEGALQTILAMCTIVKIINTIYIVATASKLATNGRDNGEHKVLASLTKENGQHVVGQA